MRHRAATGLSRAKRLGHFPDLTALQMAQFGGYPVQIGTQNRQGRQDFGVAVARHHLGRDWLNIQAQPPGHVGLDFGGNVGVIAHRTRDHSHRDAGTGMGQSLPVAIKGSHEGQKAQPKAGGLGVNAVGPAYCRGHFVAQGQSP